MACSCCKKCIAHSHTPGLPAFLHTQDGLQQLQEMHGPPPSAPPATPAKRMSGPTDNNYLAYTVSLLARARCVFVCLSVVGVGEGEPSACSQEPGVYLSVVGVGVGVGVGDSMEHGGCVS